MGHGLSRSNAAPATAQNTAKSSAHFTRAAGLPMTRQNRRGLRSAASGGAAGGVAGAPAPGSEEAESADPGAALPTPAPASPSASGGVPLPPPGSATTSGSRDSS